ncbi:MAG: hypothetical protein ACMUEL_01310 [Flavobacteriales bacterium Tduv]
MSKNRWVVGHTFGSIKSWFESGKPHYKGLAPVYAQHLMELCRIICIVHLLLLSLFIKIDIIN